MRLTGSEEDSFSQNIVSRLNALYDDEARSFYNTDTSNTHLDLDIIKDYPELITLIEASSLPAEQKTFLVQNSRHIRYEEAGRLYNILKGIDPNGTLGYAYTLRKSLTERAQLASLSSQAEAAKLAEQAARERANIMLWVWIGVLVILVSLVGGLVFLNGKKYAKYKAIREGKLRMPYWWGTKELILWEPGEAVVLLREKKLVAMVDATGGYTSISAWSGEEYKGRITYKTQMMEYTSDTIHTSDGVTVNLDLGILWQIQNPNTYVSRIAADYHHNGTHEGQPRNYTDDPRGEKYYDRKLTETAEKWIRLLAGSTLREHICQLSVAKLISPYVQTYIHQYFQIAPDSASQKFDYRMPTTLDDARVALNAKTMEYGICIEKLEANGLKLPQNLQDKLQTVRLSFLQPAQATAETQAKRIEKTGLNEVQLQALRGLADIIGKDNVAKIEFLKAIGLAKIPFTAPYAPPFAVVQSLFSSPPSSPTAYFPDIPEQTSPEQKTVDATGEAENTETRPSG